MDKNLRKHLNQGIGLLDFVEKKYQPVKAESIKFDSIKVHYASTKEASIEALNLNHKAIRQLENEWLNSKII